MRKERLNGDVDKRIEALLKAQEEFHEKFMVEIRELKESQKKTDEQLKKTDEELRDMFKKTDEQLKKTDEELRDMFKKTDEQLKKTDEQIKKIIGSVSQVSDGYGRFVEGIVSPSAIKCFLSLGYKIKDVADRKRIFKNRVVIAEFDTFIDTFINKKKCFIIGEAKTYCTFSDIKRFIEQIKTIKSQKEYEDVAIIGFTSAIKYEKGLEKDIIKKGLYLFKVTDEIMKLSIPKGFTPTIF